MPLMLGLICFIRVVYVGIKHVTRQGTHRGEENMQATSATRISNTTTSISNDTTEVTANPMEPETNLDGTELHALPGPTTSSPNKITRPTLVTQLSESSIQEHSAVSTSSSLNNEEQQEATSCPDIENQAVAIAATIVTSSPIGRGGGGGGGARGLRPESGYYRTHRSRVPEMNHSKEPQSPFNSRSYKETVPVLSNRRIK